MTDVTPDEEPSPVAAPYYPAVRSTQHIPGPTYEAMLITLGRVEAAATNAAATAKRTEDAVGSLSHRVGKLEVDVAGLKATHQSEQQARQEDAALKSNPWMVAGVIIAALASVISLISLVIYTSQ